MINSYNRGTSALRLLSEPIIDDKFRGYVPLNAAITPAMIAASQDSFEKLKNKGIIATERYDDDTWTLRAEYQTVNVCFGVDAVALAKHTRAVGGSVSGYYTTIRIVTINLIGSALRSIQTIIAGIRGFFSTGKIPDDPLQCWYLREYLVLMPGDSEWREELIFTLGQVPARKSSQRKLCDIYSYARFNKILDQFWAGASEQERVEYYPVRLWWEVTSIIPMRPTGFVLTPRDCVSYDAQGQPYFSSRTTRQKATRRSARYSLDSDYIIQSWPISEMVAKEIEWYLEATKTSRLSTLGTLFPIPDTAISSTHFTYGHMHNLLMRFFVDVVQKQFGYTVWERDAEIKQFREMDIERITLGDTRHLALISLALSGGGPALARYLASHEDPDSFVHYATNMSSILQSGGLYWDPNRSRWGVDEHISLNQDNAIQSICDAVPVAGGVCLSIAVRDGDYSHCLKQVNELGDIGSCNKCVFFCASNSSDLRSTADNRLHETIVLAKDAIQKYYAAMGSQEEVQVLFRRLRTDAIGVSTAYQSTRGYYYDGTMQR